MKPDAYVLSSHWFGCTIKGRAGRRIQSIKLVQARESTRRAAVEQQDEEGLETDPLRYERCRNIVLRAHLSNHPTKSTAKLVETRPSQLVFNDKGICEFEAFITGSGGPYEIAAADEGKQETFSPMFGVRTRLLSLTTTVHEWEQQLEEGPSEEWPKSWLKDMGKKDKTISFAITVTPPLDHRLGLRTNLVYSDGLIVPNAKILAIKDSPLELSDKKTTCPIAFRITDVSKNHQSKPFVVLVEANNQDEDISPAAAYPVVVKSKINKKKAKEDLSGEPVKKKPKKQQTTTTSTTDISSGNNSGGTSISISIADALNKNSQERQKVEALLSELQEETRKNFEKTKSAFDRLLQLSQERMELEKNFSSLFVQFGNENKLDFSTAGAASSSAIAAAASTIRSFSEAKPFFMPGSGSFEAFPADTTATLFPPNLLRLSSGDMFSLALPLDQMLPSITGHSLSLLHPSHVSGAQKTEKEIDNKNNNDEVSESEDDEEDEENVAFIQTFYVDLPTKQKKCWPAFNAELKVIGYFDKDCTFYGLSSVKDSSWISQCEQVAKIGKDITPLHMHKTGTDEFIQHVTTIINQQKSSPSS